MMQSFKILLRISLNMNVNKMINKNFKQKIQVYKLFTITRQISNSFSTTNYGILNCSKLYRKDRTIVTI